MKPILFTHIPKTAGTSLNTCAKQLFGAQAVECDYGASEPHTTVNVKRFIYQSPTVDQFGFMEAAKKAGVRWITGHFAADRFVHLCGAPNMVSFVRDPVERVISEYRHLVRAGKMDRNFEEFYTTEAEINKQFKMIGIPPWRAYHLVGTQEAYARCIKLLAAELALPLESLKENIKPTTDNEPVSDGIRKKIAELNELDYRFVTQVKAYLDQHFAASQVGRAFCYHEFGFTPDTHIIGWAFYRNSEVPVNIDLYVNGKCAATAQASEYRPELQAVGAPRQGHCGFRFVLGEFKTAQHIAIKAQDTNQLLFEWHRP